MRKQIIAIALAFSLSACAGVTNLIDSYNYIAEKTVPTQTLVVAVNTYNALAATATNYFNYCRPRLQEAICSAENRRLVLKGVRGGRAARNKLMTYINTNTPAPSVIYNTLLDTVYSLQKTPITGVPR